MSIELFELFDVFEGGSLEMTTIDPADLGDEYSDPFDLSFPDPSIGVSTVRRLTFRFLQLDDSSSSHWPCFPFTESRERSTEVLVRREDYPCPVLLQNFMFFDPATSVNLPLLKFMMLEPRLLLMVERRLSIGFFWSTFI